MIFYNTRNLSYLLKEDCSVVITGDSLAYNRYDFVKDSRMDAWDCPIAMKSWSFLLRDYLISNSMNWIPATELKIESTHISTASFKKLNQRRPYSSQLPMENQGLVIQSPEIKIKGCPENLCLVTQPTKAALIKTDDKVVDLTGNEHLFGGRYYKWVKSKSGMLSNIEKDSFVYIAGAADRKTEVFLTGSGSKTAEWLLENSEKRILKYKPDLCIMIIGANNRRMNSPESFKAALYELIEKLKEGKSEILLISPPHSKTTDPPRGGDLLYSCDKITTQPIMDVLKKAAFEFRIPYIDLFEFFSGVPGDVWRFDNTHFTKEGNLMLFKAIRDNFFKE